ncbi:Tam3-transposase (Ac family) protein [Dioscorea alata]|uniref:Tam3-transposase (Ac family) protein n=1 Tax=Dioscorea alata TaxID=55571 RepID=A0ACB7VE45_DIOAL|nr:Tam3-transposase (Ac family) protein [Dioscorea alata]
MESTSLNQSVNLDEEELEITKSGKETSKKQKEFSDVWNFFIKKGVGQDGIQIAECKGCKKEYKCGGKKYGTSSLRRHKDNCKMIKFNDVGQMFFDHEGKIRSKKVDQKIASDLLAAAVIKNDLPFSFVEYDGIRSWIKYVNPDGVCISRNTLVSDITRIYMREKGKLKHVLGNNPNRICLTSDVWTACTNEGYICLIGHFVDENWKLNSKILNFAKLPPPHSGVESAAKLFEFLKEWGIEKKVFSLTLDNASSNDNMKDILKEQLSLHDSLLCGGEFFHICCSAHILNLIVQEDLKVAHGALHKIRESVKYVKCSESRMKKFKECVTTIGNINTSIGLRLDVVIKYKRAFSSLQLNDRNYKYCPSNEELKRGEKIYEFLEPFYDTTNLISGSSYPTSNLYFMQVWKIEVLLKENLSSEDMVISDMCRKMKEKFDKYWTQYSMVLAFGAILDPRIKLSMLAYFYGKVESDSTKGQEKVSLVRTKLYALFEHYSNANKSCSSQPQSSSIITPTFTQGGGGMKSKGKRIFDEIKEFESQSITSAGKSQLDLYLEEPKLEFAYYEDLDVLEYWKNHKHRFPILALMAGDVLAIPITTVASESAFSIGACVLNKYRSCTLLEKVQALICTRNWLHGYNIDNEDEANTKPTTSGEGSNILELIDEDRMEGGDGEEENLHDLI